MTPFLLREPRTLPTRMQCAGVAYQAETNEFVFKDMNYGVDLDEISDPIELLDWCVHLGRKTWVKAEQLSEMVDFVRRQKGWLK
jgi:hypothetical protein